MNPICREIRDRLATDGPSTLQEDAVARDHVAECNDCFEFLESLSAVEAGLRDLQQFDVADDVVERLLVRPELAESFVSPDESSPRSWLAAVAALLRPRPLVWGSVATAFLIVAVAVSTRFKAPDSPADPFVVAREELADRVRENAKSEFREEGAVGDDDLDQLRIDAPARTREAESEARERKVIVKKDAPTPVDDPDTQDKSDAFGFEQDGRQSTDPNVAGPRDYAATVGGVSGSKGETEGSELHSIETIKRLKALGYLGKEAALSEPTLLAASRTAPDYPSLARTAGIDAQVVVQVLVSADGTVAGAVVLECNRPDLGFEQAAIDAVMQWRFEPARSGDEPVDAHTTITVDFDLDAADPPEQGRVHTDENLLLAQDFLSDLTDTEGLKFRPANGYWSNTYVPGDPVMRLLHARLAGPERSLLDSWLPSTPRLHDASRRVGQPFDRPDASALGVYLHADRNGLAGEGRMLVQVGIEATPRHAGRRPAMNLALVLDLGGEMQPEVAASVRSLLAAFNRAKQPGDRFRLFVANRAGDLAVDPGDFRHGVLEVTLGRAMAEVAGDVPVSSVVDAVSAAITGVAAADDPTAPLGSSAVVLITSRGFGGATHVLADLAHQGAVAGIPLSVVGVGGEVDTHEMDVVTLAGQGHRRLLDQPAQAASVVDRELSAASRAVARAVRLRIRLAPGVKLVDVIGGERLDERRARRVRQAERSIDLRLARNLGIVADRGEDEEGIQIVIPSFYAGDSHVIVLDVVAPGPGPVTDVTARFKDLVHLRNGTVRSSLSLGHEERPAGPLERNVLKNRLALRLAETMEQAGAALTDGDAPRAAGMLAEAQSLLEGLRRLVPGLAGDPDLVGDIAMLGEYRALLATGAVGQPAQRQYLADSLRYAGLLKVRAQPLETRS